LRGREELATSYSNRTVAPNGQPADPGPFSGFEPEVEFAEIAGVFRFTDKTSEAVGLAGSGAATLDLDWFDTCVGDCYVAGAGCEGVGAGFTQDGAFEFQLYGGQEVYPEGWG
jgi:hypothetical protein